MTNLAEDIFFWNKEAGPDNRPAPFAFSIIEPDEKPSPRPLSQSELQAKVAALPNQPPDQPLAPTPAAAGQVIGAINTGYNFKFQAFDQDGDGLKYKIDWGDGSMIQETPTTPSGAIAQTAHAWTAQGTYSIKVQAVQVLNGSEVPSAWSPAYLFHVTPAFGAQLAGPMTIGGMGGIMGGSGKTLEFAAEELVVGQSNGENNAAQWGNRDIAAPDGAGVTLGAQGVGGSYAAPPAKAGLSSFMSLAGDTQQEKDAIAAGLRQHGYGASYKDLNGNYQILGGRWMRFDVDNRISRVIIPDGTVTDMTYNHTGQRVKKMVTPAGGSPTTTLFIGSIYEVTNGVGTKHIFAGNQRIAQVTGGTIYYHHQDHLGSTSLVTDGAGTVVQAARYTPFGGVWSSNGSATDINYTGHRLDPTGLIYAGARYYDPALGHWITPDVLIQAPYDPQSLNRYAYVRNNPVNLIDPAGYSWLSKTWRGTMRHSFEVGLGIQALTGNFSYGAPFLAQTERGRNVLAGEIVAMTAVATVAFGGPVWAGAFSGELIGGYSAYRSDDNILSGVMVGGAVGAATGYLGNQAGEGIMHGLGGNAWGHVLGGSANGAILGAGAGGVAGYAGGQGGWHEIVQGTYQGAVVGGVIGGGVGYLSYARLQGGERLGDLRRQEIMKRIKEGWNEGIQRAAQNHSRGPAMWTDIGKSIGQKFATPAVNSLAVALPANVGYGIASAGAGLQQTDDLFTSFDWALGGSLKFK